MDQDSQQYLEIAKEGLAVARKSGILEKVRSIFSSRSLGHQVQRVDYREQALKVLQQNAVDTFSELALTVGEAAQILEPGFTLEDLDKVNSTWKNHWAKGASNVGSDDDERRTWWARLLAGEIQQPETYSLRTLAVMDTLSTKEATLFKMLCDYVWNPDDPLLVMPSDKSILWKPSFSEEMQLESAGLVKFDPLAGFTWGMTKEIAKDEIAGRWPMHLQMTIANNLYLIAIPKGKRVQLPCGKLQLTDVGQEMYRLTTPNDQPSYRDEIVEGWKKSYTVTVYWIGPSGI